MFGNHNMRYYLYLLPCGNLTFNAICSCYELALQISSTQEEIASMEEKENISVGPLLPWSSVRILIDWQERLWASNRSRLRLECVWARCALVILHVQCMQFESKFHVTNPLPTCSKHAFVVAVASRWESFSPLHIRHLILNGATGSRNQIRREELNILTLLLYFHGFQSYRCSPKLIVSELYVGKWKIRITKFCAQLTFLTANVLVLRLRSIGYSYYHPSSKNIQLILHFNFCPGAQWWSRLNRIPNWAYLDCTLIMSSRLLSTGTK